MLTVELAVSGLAFGSLAALSGLGLLITYRATGVFNLAHGAIAMVVAYAYWWLAADLGVPALLAAPVALLGVGPLLGVLAYRLVFRDLQRRAAPPAESLVASLGLFVLLVGVVALVFGLQARRAPRLFPAARFHVGAAGVGADAVVDLAVVLLALLLLWLVTTRTRLGVEVRAVVAARSLAELSRVDADRVATLGWAVGAGFAGLSGVLIAPQLSLTPFGLTLLVLETFAVPVVARLASFPVAVTAALAVGVAQSELSQLPVGSTGLGAVVQALRSNLLAVLLLGALLVLPRLRELGGDAGVAATFASRRDVRRSARQRAARYAAAAVLLAAPLAFPGPSLRDAQQVPALALVFVSLVVLTGYSGQISLGHGAYAGLGALLFASFSADISEVPALLVGMVGAGLVGLLTGYPAIRRRGLFLALTTFAVGVVVDRFVFQEPVFTSGLQVHRPAFLGRALAGDRAFYLFELGALALGLLVVRNLRTGRLGRALVAMRDSEEGARSVGIDLRRLKVFVFTTSAALAGLGGGLLVQARLAFQPSAFGPVQSSLFWFTAVVVFGADSAAGAVAAAALVVTVGAVLGSIDAAFVPVGLLALLIGRFPGGISDLVRRAARWRPHPAAPAAAPPAVRLSPAGRLVRERVGR